MAADFTQANFLPALQLFQGAGLLVQAVGGLQQGLLCQRGHLDGLPPITRAALAADAVAPVLEQLLRVFEPTLGGDSGPGGGGARRGAGSSGGGGGGSVADGDLCLEEGLCAAYDAARRELLGVEEEKEVLNLPVAAAAAAAAAAIAAAAATAAAAPATAAAAASPATSRCGTETGACLVLLPALPEAPPLLPQPPGLSTPAHSLRPTDLSTVLPRPAGPQEMLATAKAALAAAGGHSPKVLAKVKVVELGGEHLLQASCWEGSRERGRQNTIQV